MAICFAHKKKKKSIIQKNRNSNHVTVLFIIGL